MSDAAGGPREARLEELRRAFTAAADEYPGLEAVVCRGGGGWLCLAEDPSPRSALPSLRNLLKNPDTAALKCDRLWAADGVDGMVEWGFRLYDTAPGREGFFGLDGHRAETPEVRRYCVLADRACRALGLRPALARGTPPVEWLAHLSAATPPLSASAVKFTWVQPEDSDDPAEGDWVEVDVGPRLGEVVIKPSELDGIRATRGEVTLVNPRQWADGRGDVVETVDSGRGPVEVVTKPSELDRTRGPLEECELNNPHWWAVGLGNVFEASAAAIERLLDGPPIRSEDAADPPPDPGPTQVAPQPERHSGAGATPTPERPLPVFNAGNRTLSIDGKPIKQWKNQTSPSDPAKAGPQLELLQAFQSAGWTDTVTLKGTAKVRQTVKDLMRDLKRRLPDHCPIEFRCVDKSTAGWAWKAVEGS